MENEKENKASGLQFLIGLVTLGVSAYFLCKVLF